MSAPRRRRANAGFTLLEAIMVIVITGILSATLAVFIQRSAEAYFDAVRRAELTDAADVSLRQMAREVRLALPNSLRFVCPAAGNPGAGFCFIEFILTRSGGRYRDTGDGSTAGNILDFASAAATTFDVLGPPAGQALAVNDRIVVFNLGPGFEPANAYCSMDPANCPGGAPAGGNVATVTGLAGNTVTLNANPFALQSPPLPSPSARFQVVPAGVDAVSYICPTIAAGAVTRRWNYGYNAVQPVAFAGGSSATLLDNATCVVDYTPAVLQRNGLLYVEFTIRDATANETVTVFQQVHVDNTP